MIEIIERNDTMNDVTIKQAKYGSNDFEKMIVSAREFEKEVGDVFKSSSFLVS